MRDSRYTITSALTTAALCGLALGVALCGALAVTVAASQQQSFTLSVNPTHLTVVQGSAASTTVTVGSVNGFSGTVTLTAASSPPGLSVTISPTTIVGNGTATVTVVGSAPGNFTVAVTGNCCNMTRSAAFLVTVTSPPPPPAIGQYSTGSLEPAAACRRRPGSIPFARNEGSGSTRAAGATAAARATPGTRAPRR